MHLSTFYNVLKNTGTKAMDLIFLVFEGIIFVAFMAVVLPVLTVNHIMYWLSKVFYFMTRKRQKEYFAFCADMGEDINGYGVTFIAFNHFVSFIKLSDKTE